MRLLALAGLMSVTFGLSVVAALAAPLSPAWSTGGLNLSVVRSAGESAPILMPGDVHRTRYVVSVSRDARLRVVPAVDVWDPLARSLLVRLHNGSSGEFLFEGNIDRAGMDAGLIYAGQPRELMIDIVLPIWASETTSGQPRTIVWSFLATDFDASL